MTPHLPPTHEEMTEFLTAVFTAWSEKNIRYVVLRNYENLPYETGNDIDILIAPEQFAEASELLKSAAVRTQWHLHNAAQFVPLSLFFHKEGSLHQIHFDLFDSLKWRGFDTFPVADILATRQPYKMLFIPSPEYVAAINLCTNLLFNGIVKEKYRPEILSVANNSPEKFLSILEGVFGEKRVIFLADSARAARWEVIEKSVSPLRKNLRT